MEKSLLPFNASPLEQSTEHSINRAFNLPMPIDTLWNPESCPEPLLPWLAWTFSVDAWDSEWQESIKRNVIANSVSVHRKKGTLGALKRVLNDIGITVEIQEWFETNAPPHTFNVTAYVNDNNVPDSDVILDPILYNNVIRAIDNVKPVRSHYDFRVAVRFELNLGLATVSSTTIFKRVTLIPRVDTSLNTQVNTAITTNVISVIRAKLHA